MPCEIKEIVKVHRRILTLARKNGEKVRNAFCKKDDTNKKDFIPLYRKNYYKTDSNNELEIDVVKNRSGSTGKVMVSYQVDLFHLLAQV